MTLPIRVLHLPMAFNERWTHGAIQKYMRSVRCEGPYLPSNVDFVAANNGLTGRLSVHSCIVLHSITQCNVALHSTTVYSVADDNGLTGLLLLWNSKIQLCEY